MDVSKLFLFLAAHGQALTIREARPSIMLISGTNSRGMPGGHDDEPVIDLSSCPKQCDFVKGKDSFKTADAVVWDFCNYQEKWIPKKNVEKPEKQKWIFSWEQEAENYHNCHGSKKLMKTVGDKIDWTMTYNKRSDFWLPYATMIKRKDWGEVFNKVDYKSGKEHLMLWLVGSMSKTSNRIGVFSELKKHLDGENVHMYGRHGNDGPWPCDKGHGETDGSDCNRAQFSKYKFYFAAENARCEDYITEKFWKALQYGMVPVVLGGLNRTDYERVADGSSFIHVDDFNSTEALAKHLKELNNNDEAYGKYFEWHSTHEVSMTSARDEAWCDLCTNLHSGAEAKKKTENLNDWWTKGTCL